MSIPAEILIKMYRAMLRIRRFEEQIWEVYTSGLMHGVGGISTSAKKPLPWGFALRCAMTILSPARIAGTGIALPKAGDLEAMMAEVMGRVTGHCRGKGGSMHIADMSVGILGANGIVGGGFGIATGRGSFREKARDGPSGGLLFWTTARPIRAFF